MFLCGKQAYFFRTLLWQGVWCNGSLSLQYCSFLQGGTYCCACYCQLCRHHISQRDDHWKNTGCARLSSTCSCRIRTKACWFLIRECSGSPPCTSIWVPKDGMGRNRFLVLWSEHQSPLEQVENFPTSFFLHHVIWNRYLWQLTVLLIFSSVKAEHCPGVRTPTSRGNFYLGSTSQPYVCA